MYEAEEAVVVLLWDETATAYHKHVNVLQAVFAQQQEIYHSDHETSTPGTAE